CWPCWTRRAGRALRRTRPTPARRSPWSATTGPAPAAPAPQAPGPAAAAGRAAAGTRTGAAGSGTYGRAWGRPPGATAGAYPGVSQRRVQLRLDLRRRRGRAVACSWRGERMHASRICLALCLASLALPLAAKQKFTWPEGRKAAVSLAYDDALDSQLDNAVPALQKHGLKGTFYIVPARESVRTRMEEWRAVARMGHELGNHSIIHPCSAHGPGREFVPPHQDLDRLSVAQMKEQVEVAVVFLQALDSYTGPRTYTAPCGDRNASDGDYNKAVADRFAGIKMVGGDVVPDMHALDPAAVPAAVPTEVTGKQLIALVEQAGR